MLVGTPPEQIPAPNPVPRKGRAWAAIAIAAVLLLVTGVVAWSLHDTGPRYPDHWDPRVAGIVRWVQNARGLDYEHPVRVYFLSPKQYTHVATRGSQKPTKADRTQSRRNVGELRALGVVEGDPDLLSNADSLRDNGTLAFYDFDAKVVNVRGHRLTPALRVTLAHELTHVLQDQHFDISHTVDGPDSEAASAARSVVEGDAVDIENQYVDEVLTKTERAEYEKEDSASTEQATGQLDDVPDFLTTSFGAPYAFGPPFVTFFGSDHKGVADNDAVDELLRDPPPAMSRLFDPTDQIDEARILKVSEPKGPGKVFDSGSLGAVTVFAMLADRIDGTVAMDATDGWGGDSYIARATGKGSGEKVCVDIRMRAQDDDGRTELREALEQWQKAMPAAAGTKVGRDGPGVITVATCDPGPASSGIGDRFSQAISYPVVRLQIAQGVFSQAEGKFTRSRSVCIGDDSVKQFSADELSATELTPELEQKLEQVVGDATQNC